MSRRGQGRLFSLSVLLFHVVHAVRHPSQLADDRPGRFLSGARAEPCVRRRRDGVALLPGRPRPPTAPVWLRHRSHRLRRLWRARGAHVYLRKLLRRHQRDGPHPPSVSSAPSVPSLPAALHRVGRHDLSRKTLLRLLRGQAQRHWVRRARLPVLGDEGADRREGGLSHICPIQQPARHVRLLLRRRARLLRGAAQGARVRTDPHGL